MAMTPDELIDTSMMLIVHSGDARAAAFHALQEAKAGNYEEAKKLMAESKAKALEAHHIQTGLLTDEGNGEGPQVNLLLVHAQDHLMTSMLAQELIAELIELHEKKADKYACRCTHFLQEKGKRKTKPSLSVCSHTCLKGGFSHGKREKRRN